MADMQTSSRLLYAVQHATVCDNWKQMSVARSQVHKAAQIDDIMLTLALILHWFNCLKSRY